MSSYVPRNSTPPPYHAHNEAITSLNSQHFFPSSTLIIEITRVCHR